MDFKDAAACKNAAASEHSNSLLHHEVAGNQLFKFSIAVQEGFRQFLPNVSYAITDDAHHPTATAEKVLAACATGAALRFALPEAGAVRTLIGASLALQGAKDVFVPFAHTYQLAYRAQTIDSLNRTGDELGKSLGRFAVDTTISLAAGCQSEKVTGKILLAGLGDKNYLHFEYSKHGFWNTAALAKYIHAPAFNIQTILACLHISQTENTQLTLNEKINRIYAANKLFACQIKSEQFYKYGPLTASGQRIDFSDYLDKLVGKVSSTNSRLLSRSKRTQDSTSSDGIFKEFSAVNLSALASAVKKQMSGLSNQDIQLADIKEQLQAPIFSVSDSTRSGALLGYEFKHSAKQLCELIAGIKNYAQLSNAGETLDLHAKSAIQDELKLCNVLHLNLFAKELHNIFVDQIKKAGICNRSLAHTVPSRVAVTDDHGYVNFTIPPITGVIDRPVTVFPRNQVDLESVLSGINRHEMIGHDYLWGQLPGFAGELHDEVLPQAVRNAMLATNFKDSNIAVPGLGTIKKSEFFLKVLQSQANENISDLIGTASGGADTALGLGILLQSLRRDGLLETGSFLSSQFEEYIEPHGIDRWRIKLCAELMRQLAPQNLEVLKQAQALDRYAAYAARPGRYYIWAHEENGGQVAVRMKDWDALLPEVLRTQLETPLKSLEGRRLKDILPDISRTVSRIEALASIMECDLRSNKSILPSIFNPKQYSIGEVYAAGLRTWMHMTAQGIDPSKSLIKISRLSKKLCDSYF
jgi:hypothetical protein